MTALDFGHLSRLLDGADRVDAPCPLCSSDRKPQHRRLKVLRVWRKDRDLICYNCAHCEAHGFEFADDDEPRSRVAAAGGRGVRGYLDEDKADAAQARQVRAEAAALEITAEQRERIAFARRLAGASVAAAGTPGEVWVRRRLGRASGLLKGFPDTIRYLPPGVHRDGHALIGLHGWPDEPEPGVLAMPIERVMAVQASFLNANASGRAPIEVPRRSFGVMASFPLVLAPMNDLLGLVIGEGLIKVWDVQLHWGVGAWVAGGASFLQRLAAVAPTYVDSVRVLADDDAAGLRAANGLYDDLRHRFPSLDLGMIKQLDLKAEGHA